MRRAALGCSWFALAALGCGADEARCGSGTATPGSVEVTRIDGARVAFVDESGCYRAVHDGGVEAMLEWSWGDGENSTGSGGEEACHAWSEPGSVLVSVSVTAERRSASATTGVAVVHRPLDPLPTHSSTIVLDAPRGRVWSVNPDADSVAVLSADVPALIAELPTGAHPRSVAISGKSVAVACQDGDSLALFDAETLAARQRVDLGGGSRPFGVVADPRGGRFAVSLQGTGRVVLVDAGSGAQLGAADTGPDPRGLAFAPDGRLLVARWRADTVEGATLTVLDAADPSAPFVRHSVALPPDTDGDTDTDNNGVPGFVAQVVPSPSFDRVVLPSLKANVVTGMFRTGAPLSSQTTARGILSVLETLDAEAAPVERAEGRHPFDDLDYAAAAAFSAGGSRLWVAFQGAQRAVVLDARSLDVAGSIADTGAAPQGLVTSADDTLLFVQAFLDRTVRVFDISDLAAGEPPLVAEISTVASEPLAADVLAGKRIFYASRDPRMSLSSYLSCASCHLDGEGDGLTWDFTQRGEGLRNTIPLRGRAGLGDGMLHWSANFDELQDFEHDIRNAQGGTGFLADAVFASGSVGKTLGDPKAGLSPELDALAAYVTSLSGWGRSPLRRHDDPEWVASRARGEALFLSAGTGCATCHVPPRYTDSTVSSQPVLHDVGTLSPASGQRLGQPLTGLDTPTLHGLWKSAPYLHDGSAPALHDVLVARNPADLHGATSTLSSSDLADLEAFLLSLDDASY